MGTAAGAAASAYTTAADAFIQRGKELQKYDSGLAGANARAEVQGIRSDIREAQELGQAVARLTDAQTKLDAELREILLPVKKFLAVEVAKITEFLAQAVEEIRKLNPLAKDKPLDVKSLLDEALGLGEIPPPPFPVPDAVGRDNQRLNLPLFGP